MLSDSALQAQLRMAPSAGTNRLGIHVDIPPFDDLRVRQAIATAIDKQAIVQKRSGTVTALEGHFTPPMLQYDPDFKSNYQYDVETAKGLMAEAGYADGIEGVKFYIGQDQEVGQLIQADLAAIGIATELMVGSGKIGACHSVRRYSTLYVWLGRQFPRCL
ncbi:MAG: ABC transporter substrate-binding protein [Caldilineaceae bacterium]